MSRRNTPQAPAFTSPYVGYSPSDENVFYIPIPASGKIVLQTLTPQQRRLLDNMGKPSPPVADDSPEMPPTMRRSISSPRRHNLGPAPAPSLSPESDNPAYRVSPRVQDSMERVRLQKERLAAMRRGRVAGGVGTPVSPPETSIARPEEVIRIPHGTPSGSSNPEPDCAGDAWAIGCGSSDTQSWTGSDEGKAGFWEPLFSGTTPEGGLDLEGLGISVWTEDDPTCRELLQDSSSGEVTGPAVDAEGDNPDNRESSVLLDDEGADPYADDGSRTVRVRSPPASDNTSRDTSPVPETEIERSERSFNLLSTPTFICCTGPVSKSVLLLAWGWNSPVLVQQEGQAGYLERGIELARKRMGVPRG